MYQRICAALPLGGVRVPAGRGVERGRRDAHLSGMRAVVVVPDRLVDLVRRVGAGAAPHGLEDVELAGPAAERPQPERRPQPLRRARRQRQPRPDLEPAVGPRGPRPEHRGRVRAAAREARVAAAAGDGGGLSTRAQRQDAAGGGDVLRPVHQAGQLGVAVAVRRPVLDGPPGGVDRCVELVGPDEPPPGGAEAVGVGVGVAAGAVVPVLVRTARGRSRRCRRWRTASRSPSVRRSTGATGRAPARRALPAPGRGRRDGRRRRRTSRRAPAPPRTLRSRVAPFEAAV